MTLPVFADDHISIVKEAFSNLSNDYHQEWAFTHSATEGDVQFVGRYDPRFPSEERWKLISIDGRVPTEQEIEEYQDDMGDEFHDDGPESDDEIIDFETLDLIEETEKYRVYRFTPDVGSDEDSAGRKFMQHVDGTIKIIRDGNYIQTIDLRNDKPVRPAFSVKISKFRTHLTFGPATEDGPIVPISIDVEVKGRAILFVKIDESESVRFTDYERVGT